MSSAPKSTPTTFRGLPVIPPSSKSNDTSVPRKVAKCFLAIEQAEGAGARVRRSIGTPKLRNFSPFLMLDHFAVKPGAGFPDHAHIGFETATLMLEGAVDHEDFAGNRGTIQAGDLQFMTAGRGIVHAEMPRQNEDGSANVGMQLWIDLPQELKKCEPRYRDLRKEEIPVVSDDGVTVKVISGRYGNTESVKELAYTPVWLLDVDIKPGNRAQLEVPDSWNAFAYLLEGSATFGVGQDGRTIDQYHIAVFEKTGNLVNVEVDADASKSTRFIFVAGLPLDQPVVQYGPFVLNTQQEVYQALRDYQTFSNGFERAENWKSEIGKSMVP